MLPVTERLAQFIVETSYEQLSPEVVETAENAILDCLGTTLAGSREEDGRLVAAQVREYRAAPTSTVIGAGFKTAPPLAALANGTAGHTLDYDDGSVSFHGHPSVAIVPALLAMAETYGATGRDLISAYVVAFEVGFRIGTAVNMRHYHLGFHTTSTVGVFRAVAAAGRLLHLDVPATQRALGIAASMSCGLRANFGTMTKPLHAGLADQNGVMAAQLAARGFTANMRILETEGGFCDAFCAGKEYYPERILDNLGNPFSAEKPGIIFKLFPCCQGGHPLIQGILHLRETQGLRAEQVEKIRVGVNYLRPQIMPYGQPKSTSEARFSMPYCTAVALLDGRAGLQQFTETRMKDPAVGDLIGKVETYVHPSMKDNLAQGAELDVILKDGRSLHHSVEVPWFEKPTPVARDRLEEKFRDCAVGTLSPAKSDRVIQLVETLPQQQSVKALMAALLAKPQSK